MDRTTLKIGGKLRISGDVIADIAEAAASEINGVSLKDNNRLETAVNIPFIKDFVSPVRVRVGNDAVAIDISVIIEGGNKACAGGVDFHYRRIGTACSMLHKACKIGIKILRGTGGSNNEVDIPGRDSCINHGLAVSSK